MSLAGRHVAPALYKVSSTAPSLPAGSGFGLALGFGAASNSSNSSSVEAEVGDVYPLHSSRGPPPPEDALSATATQNGFVWHAAGVTDELRGFSSDAALSRQREQRKRMREKVRERNEMRRRVQIRRTQYLTAPLLVLSLRSAAVRI